MCALIAGSACELTESNAEDHHPEQGAHVEGTSAMDGFDHILNWELKAGSHPFPGRDGGTCINEAALIAAGFEYRPIRGVEDMPECFSPPICRLAMQLNDTATDDQ